MIVVITLLVCVGTVQAEEWPTFKHDTQRTGYSDAPGPENDEIAWVFTADAGLSSPAVENYLVFVGSRGGFLYAVSIFNGKEVWKFEARGQVSSPTFADGLVYFGSLDHSVYCLKTSDGAMLWEYETDGPIFTSPTVVAGAAYVTGSDGHVYSIDTTTGLLNWEKSIDYQMASSPVVSGELLIFGTGEKVVALQLTDGTITWIFNMGAPAPPDQLSVSTPAVTAGRVFMSSHGHIFALDTLTGAFIWDFQADSRIESSPTVLINIAYFGLSDGYLYALDARDNVTARVVWEYETEETIQSSPAVAGNKLFVASQDGYLYSLEAMDGELLWRHQIGASGSSSPAIAYSKVFIGTEDGKLYCFGIWGSVSGDKLETGLIYVSIALVLMILMWGLARLRLSKK